MLGGHFFEEVSEDSLHPDSGEHLFTTHPSGQKRVGALPTVLEDYRSLRMTM
jgi:hypothetical protein